MTRLIELSIGGMTCASCAARVEKKLNRIDGVTSSVNFATETAHVTHPADVSVDELVKTVTAIGYTARAAAPAAESDPDGHRRAARATAWRLIASALLSAPVMVISMVGAARFAGSGWVVLALATPVVGICALPFHKAAWAGARHGTATMDTLISLGAGVSYLWSVWALIAGGAETYFEVGAALTTFLLAGRHFEARSKARASTALRTLLALGAKDVAVLRDGAETRVPIGALRVGDEFVVRPGERVAADGVVVDGASAVDTSLLTGESVPVEVGVGDQVIGAAVNAGGRLLVRATRVGADTQLAAMARLVAQAQSGKAPVQRLADRVAGVFVPVVIALAALTFAGWLIGGASGAHAMTAAVAVLIVACPCALGLATPMALLVGSGRGATLGIVIRGPQVLEATRRVDTVVLDKTGTVTTGRMAVAEVRPADGVDEGQVLRDAAAVEAGSEHPIARAIVAATPPFAHRLDDFQALPGLGARGRVNGRQVLVGRPALLREHGIDVPEGAEAPRAARTLPGAAVAVASDGVYLGEIVVSDQVRPSSASAVARMRALGLRPVLLTGDSRAAAEAVAAEVGIEDVIAEVLPAGKLDAVTSLQRDGRVVAMVGDGVNDAAALAAADLGIAMGAGTDVAIAASDLTLMRSDLAGVPDAIRLSRATLGAIKGNLFWAFAYNVAALPLAVAGLVTPVIAAAAMAMSSAFVVANSLRLRRFR